MQSREILIALGIRQLSSWHFFCERKVGIEIEINGGDLRCLP
jgi:hypothetical protein